MMQEGQVEGVAWNEIVKEDSGREVRELTR